MMTVLTVAGLVLLAVLLIAAIVITAASSMTSDVVSFALMSGAFNAMVEALFVVLAALFECLGR
jgi:hypothetical protein